MSAYPAPYRAALALSIDCDGCTVERLHRVFGCWSTELGLPVASSMFVYSRNPKSPPQAAYLDGDRDGLLDAYRRGWIDTLHTLGDLVTPCGRDLARRAFETLSSDGVRLSVWTNHGGPENVQNLLRANAAGDVPGSATYLADLAIEYGIRFVWASELTPIVGQNREANPSEYYSRWIHRFAHAISPRLVRKLGVEPYSGNRLIEPRSLRDGRRVLVFRRYGRWRHDTISRLPSILDGATLDRLIETGGAMIVYLHIGPSADETPESFRAGMTSLDEVARRFREGSLWVARTSDLLAHLAVPANP